MLRGYGISWLSSLILDNSCTNTVTRLTFFFLQKSHLFALLNNAATFYNVSES